MYQCKQCKKKFKRQRDKRQHEFNCSFIMAAKGELKPDKIYYGDGGVVNNIDDNWGSFGRLSTKDIIDFFVDVLKIAVAVIFIGCGSPELEPETTPEPIRVTVPCGYIFIDADECYRLNQSTICTVGDRVVYNHHDCEVCPDEADYCNEVTL